MTDTQPFTPDKLPAMLRDPNIVCGPLGGSVCKQAAALLDANATDLRMAERVRVDLKAMRARMKGVPVEQEYDTHGLDYTTCIGHWIDKMRAENAKLRLMLAIGVAGAMLYTDDGELQDNTERPFIDFKRDSVDEIERKFAQRGAARRCEDWHGSERHPQRPVRAQPTAPAMQPLHTPVAMQFTKKEMRELRRENERWPEALAEVPREQWAHLNDGTEMTGHTRARVLRSRRYLVQVFEPVNKSSLVGFVMSVLRTERNEAGWVEGITWEQLQALKAEAGYGNRDAVEVYPRDVDVINIANIHHLFVMADPLPFAWRKP